jgi:hypothetical protein
MRRLVFLVAVLAGLTGAATAHAKGPIAATIDGPGAGGGISLGGNGEPGSGEPLGSLSDHAGLFPAAFGQEPDPMLAGRPSGDLGPRYTITYQLPDQSGETSRIRQDLYPYAAGGPVTYTRPGQRFFGSESTRGGWFRGTAGLKQTLVEAGLPAQEGGRVTSRPAPAPSADGGGTRLSDFWPAFVAVLLIGVAPALALLARRRARPAAGG